MPRKRKTEQPVLAYPKTDTDRNRLAYAVLDQIEANPETWNQRMYRCSTGMCFAGWAIELVDGVRWVSDQKSGRDILNGWDLLDSNVVLPSKRIVSAADAGALLLGLDDDGAADMFDARNTLDDLKDVVTELFGPRL